MIFDFLKEQKAYIVFSSEYLIGVSTYGDHHSFDINKYKRIRDLLVAEKLLKKKHVIYPRPCSNADIRLVHTEKFIQQINDPIFVNQALKIEINSLWDNTVLEYFKAVCGGTIKAAVKAVKLNKPVFNLGGGFHHSQPDKAEGFCLLNDIAIAIKKLKSGGLIDKTLIVDLDYHQGNGNGLIFRDDTSVFTFSVHADHWVDIESATNCDVLISTDISDEDYIDIVHTNLEKIVDSFRPEIIFFVAGSDPYIKDDLADMKISREAMLNRNMAVLNISRKLEVPLVILPGGGYGPNSWEIYYDFIKNSLKS